MGFQNIDDCNPAFACPEGHVVFDGQCYFEKDISMLSYYYDDLQVLIDFTKTNDVFTGHHPLLIGYQVWQNNRLKQLSLDGLEITVVPESIYKLTQLEYLNLNNNKLENLPDNLCSIYPDLQSLQVANNFICPPYPSCIENVGFQNIDDCTHPLSCPEGYVVFDGQCYYYDDLQVLIDFTGTNVVITGYHPLLIGYQVWKNSRLQQLNLDGIGITNVPESINKLYRLEYLNLNNNNLESLPENFCSIYPNLQSFQVTNNFICPPYLQCFDYIGAQNTVNCEKSFCPYGYFDIDGDCYFEKDIFVLNDFISQNKSLDGRQPLEIGIQKWKDMRLYYLYLGVNELTTIPESICEVLPELKIFNISQNKICPPYPDCVENYLGEQVSGECP